MERSRSLISSPFSSLIPRPSSLGYHTHVPRHCRKLRVRHLHETGAQSAARQRKGGGHRASSGHRDGGGGRLFLDCEMRVVKTLNVVALITVLATR